MKTKLLFFVPILCLSLGIKAQIINIPDANFKAKLLSSSPSNTVAKDVSGNYFTIDANADGEIDEGEVQVITELNISNANITTLGTVLNYFESLVKLDASNNLLTSFQYGYQLISNYAVLGTLRNASFKNNPNLQTFQFTGSPTGPYPFGLEELDVENCPSLQSVKLQYNYLTYLNIKNCTNLEELDVTRNQLTNIDFLNNTNLKSVNISQNKFTDFSVSAPLLLHLNLYNNDLTTFNIYNYPNLESLEIANNKIADVDVSNHQKIQELSVWNDYPPSSNSAYLKTVNANNCVALTQIRIIDMPNVEKIFIKNGVADDVAILDCPNVQYICCDDSEVSGIQNMLISGGVTGCNVNTYCNFVPGGNYNTITGTVRFDENNNGCDTSDEIFEHMKLKINDGTNTGETFVKNNGKYDFYTQAGNFTVTAEPENPSLFTVMPASFATSFPNNNNNIFTQDICVVKNGNANDLEVVIAPVTNAVPGFDAKYKLMWRNKGNTTMSGSAVLTFDTSKMNFVSSSLPYVISGNQITFNFSNLKPYANTASEIIFTINTPTHPTNPVNSGDQLIFSSSVNPLPGDINPQDNIFTYKQTVVNSFDPNDIVCIEGNTVPSAMVGNNLHYIVNFENTGTSNAVNIVVEMDIDPADFDISTLQLQNASHLAYTRIKNNKVEFIMKMANLGSGGHGNILMKVKSKNNLTPGDQVINKANIYFDYNFPIVTNDATTNIEGTLQTAETSKDGSVKLYPNPTKGDVNIDAGSKIKSVEVYDAQGRIIQKQIGINSQTTKVSIHSSYQGVYYFKVFTDKGVLLKKVIKD
ncbi:T9SS type A sorting domain-containing protein [Chryseobacterium shigense]|uniref:Putative repeat protein (TIGR01451 family) n=1 Tax=Chryseobacterium shigense TaxID=297244 RepID=A0A841NAR7_9FLAO|nr:T9SS type A sorting domain-containing protein [Chryseobacterium shigense]MBB6370470.1 putative repeat protein (TIGR01451 family) [Chryseobacterium shigense]